MIGWRIFRDGGRVRDRSAWRLCIAGERPPPTAATPTPHGSRRSRLGVQAGTALGNRFPTDRQAPAKTVRRAIGPWLKAPLTAMDAFSRADGGGSPEGPERSAGATKRLDAPTAARYPASSIETTQQSGKSARLPCEIIRETNGQIICDTTPGRSHDATRAATSLRSGAAGAVTAGVRSRGSPLRSSRPASSTAGTASCTDPSRDASIPA